MVRRIMLCAYCLAFMLQICSIASAEDEKLTVARECKLSPDGKQYVRILTGPPYHSETSSFCVYDEIMPVYVETPSGREKLFAKEEAEAEPYESLHVGRVPATLLDFCVFPGDVGLACVGKKKDVLLFSAIVHGSDPRWYTTVIFSYNPYKKCLERMQIHSITRPIKLYFGKDEIRVAAPYHDRRYKYRIHVQKGSEYDWYESNELPDAKKYYKVIPLPESMWQGKNII